MKTTNRFSEVCQLDVCLPDYFTGYHFPVLAIPMYNGMTSAGLAEAIEDEINGLFDYLVNDNGFTEDEIKLFDVFCVKLRETPDAVIYTDENEPEDAEDYESAFMYLSLCKPVTRYGLTFLNE